MIEFDPEDNKRIWTTRELLEFSRDRVLAAERARLERERIQCDACPDGSATVQLVGDIWVKETVGHWVCDPCWHKSPEQLAIDIGPPRPAKP